MRLACVLAFVSVAFAAQAWCDDDGSNAPVPAQDAPVRPAARHPALRDGDLNGWVPADDLVGAALRLGDPAVRESAFEELGEMPPARRVAILRAGIRLRDELAARTAALRLRWRHLDGWEAAEVVRLSTDAILDPAYFDPDGDVPNFGYQFETFGCCELGAVLDRLPSVPAERLAQVHLTILHKVAWAAHLPKAAALVRSDDPSIRAFAREIVTITGQHTDQYREHLAASSLGLTIEEALAKYPPAAEGLPPLLVAWFQSDVAPEDQTTKFSDVAWRWLRESTPAAEDVPFLLWVHEKQSGSGNDDVVPWVARELRVEALVEPARQQFDEDPDQLSELRLGSLYFSLQEAFRALLHRAATDGDALAVALALNAEVTRELVVEPLALGPDPFAAHALLDALRDASEESLGRLGVTWDEKVFDGFEEAALAAPLDGFRLALVGVSVPGCRTRRVAEAALAAMGPGRAPAGLLADDERTLVLPFLETAAPGTFRERLRTWARSEHALTRTWAIRAAVTLGMPELGPELVAWLTAEGARLHGVLPIWRSASPAVRAYLVDVVEGRRPAANFDRTQALAALARVDGMPEGVVFVDDPVGEDDFPADRRQEIEDLIVAGRPLDALAVCLEAAPDRVVWEVSLVDDDRVRAYLRRLQERRELELYWWATGELALLGDPAARAEVEAVLRCGRYRWVEEMPDRQIVLGDVNANAPRLFDLLETNCCYASTIDCFLLDHQLGMGRHPARDSAVPPARVAREFWRRHGGRFVPTRFRASSVVPAPR